MSKVSRWIPTWLLLTLTLVISSSSQATLINFSSLTDGSYSSIGDSSLSLVGNGIFGAQVASP